MIKTVRDVPQLFLLICKKFLEGKFTGNTVNLNRFFDRKTFAAPEVRILVNLKRLK